MGNKLYVTQVPTPDFKIMHPDNTVICQISRAAMKAAQEAAKAKAPAKERKNIFLQISKHQFQHRCFFFVSVFLDYLFSKLKFKTSFSELLSN
jgi:hypothetical protein